MMKNAIIVTLLILLVWFGAAINRLESYRYASFLGLCDKYEKAEWFERDKCLRSKQTRTSNFANLLFGLNIL